MIKQFTESEAIEYLENELSYFLDKDQPHQDAIDKAIEIYEEWEPQTNEECDYYIFLEKGNEITFHNQSIPKLIFNLWESNLLTDKTKKDDKWVTFVFGKNDRYRLSVNPFLSSECECPELPRFAICDDETGDQVDCYDSEYEVIEEIKEILEG